MPTKLKIKPLSVNECWQGRRKKSRDYKSYEILVNHLLPAKLEIPQGNLRLIVDVGFSSSSSDLDNVIKPFQDILQKKFFFFGRKPLFYITKINPHQIVLDEIIGLHCFF